MAEPFRYWINDAFLPPFVADGVAKAITEIPDDAWRARIHKHSIKWTVAPPYVLPEAIQGALQGLTGPAVLEWLTGLTGIPGLTGDPEHVGGGVHQSRPGSRLDIHADFLTHPTTHLRRTLNLLIYLTPDYDPAWGGHLELWDARMRRCIERIEPRFNRAVLFVTSPTSFHGHPDPMQGPPTARRNSLALYYYRPYAPYERVSYASTDYRARPWEYRVRLRKWGGRTLRKWGLKT